MERDFERYWYRDIRQIDSLKQMLTESAELFADRPAFWVKREKGQPYEAISYQLLKHDVESLGTMLIDMGLAGRRIAVMGQGCYEWIVSYLAVVCGAGIVVPVDKDLSAAEIENLMKTAECDTIFCTRGECEKLKRSDVIRNLIVMEFYGDRTSAEELPQAVPPHHPQRLLCLSAYNSAVHLRYS